LREALATAESCELKADAHNMTGYLSGPLPPSVTSSEASPVTACGTEHNPWTISVLPGQRIKFTLLDFTSNSTVPWPSAASDSLYQQPTRSVARQRDQCEVLARLDEHGSSTVAVCRNGRIRKSLAYTSVGSTVKVRLYHREPANGYIYLLKFERKFIKAFNGFHLLLHLHFVIKTTAIRHMLQT
jgi:hypothetical protein